MNYLAYENFAGDGVTSLYPKFSYQPLTETLGKIASPAVTRHLGHQDVPRQEGEERGEKFAVPACLPAVASVVE